MPYLTLVKYGKLFFRDKFKTDDPNFQKGDSCVVRTERGVELGTVLLLPEKMPEGLSPEGFGEIIRKANEEDLSLYNLLETEERKKEIQLWKEYLEKFQLSLKLVEIDHLLGGEKVFFYFISESKVDFREMVRMLSQELKTRVELRQVGARDDAKLKWDFGHCGLPLCCKNFLGDLGGINLEMARVQKHTTDPSKITGRCGKLLCCFKYEYTFYKKIDELLPRENVMINSTKGEGIVVDRNLLLQEVTIAKPGGEKIRINVSEIISGQKQENTVCEKNLKDTTWKKIED